MKTKYSQIKDDIVGIRNVVRTVAARNAAIKITIDDIKKYLNGSHIENGDKFFILDEVKGKVQDLPRRYSNDNVEQEMITMAKKLGYM